MIRSIRTTVTVLFVAASVGGCVMTPQERPNNIAASEYRNTNLDVLFATEFPVSSAEEALATAAQAMNSGDVDKALFFYVRALQFNPENVELLTHIGEIHLLRNDREMAKRALVEARKHDPAYSPAREALGLVYMAEGKDEEAIIELTTAIANNKNLWRARNALGVYADKSGDYEAAQSHYDAALIHKPDAAHVLNNRGYSKFLAGDLESAVLDLHKAADEYGFDRAWGNLAMVYASRGWYEDAVATYQKVMSDANAYKSTGQIAMKNGDYREAEKLLAEAINSSPVYFPEAEENLRQLRKLGPGPGPSPLPTVSIR